MFDLNATWDSIREQVLNQIKVYVLQKHVDDVLEFYHTKIEYVVKRYARILPQYVAENELDDLRTIAKLELLETVKVWDPSRSQDIWPLAQARIVGAMRDHIRYITKSDPSRFYEWVTDAAYVFMAIHDRADFEHTVETSVQLTQAMKSLTYREKKIVIAHTKEDLTFKEIGDRFNISESQISRIYKKSIEKIKKAIKVSG